MTEADLRALERATRAPSFRVAYRTPDGACDTLPPPHEPALPHRRAVGLLRRLAAVAPHYGFTHIELTRPDSPLPAAAPIPDTPLSPAPAASLRRALASLDLDDVDLSLLVNPGALLDATSPA